MPETEFDQLIKRNEKLSKILELGKKMSIQEDLHSLLKTIIQETSIILDADRTSLFIFDDVNQELWLKITEKQEINEIRFGIGKGVAGYVARTKNIMNIKDAYSHELFNPEIDQKTGFKTKNLLCAPMENLQGKLIGVIQVLNKKHGHFTGEDKEILLMFSSFAAILLDNSLLAEENLQKDRLAVIGNMASSIIHDINNPITAIQGLAEIIMMDSGENSGHAAHILKSVDRIKIMVNELLEFSKGIDHALIFESVNCNDFFTDMFSQIERDLKTTGIHFDYDILYSGSLDINKNKIQRAVLNFTGNACDAMGKMGQLSISVTESNDKKNIILLIIDSGKGIPLAIQKTLFEPFVTQDKTNGTGLGMAITKKIIDSHGGSITFETEEGKGTRFEIVIPKSQQY